MALLSDNTNTNTNTTLVRNTSSQQPQPRRNSGVKCKTTYELHDDGESASCIEDVKFALRGLIPDASLDDRRASAAHLAVLLADEAVDPTAAAAAAAASLDLGASGGAMPGNVRRVALAHGVLPRIVRELGKLSKVSEKLQQNASPPFPL